jgi:hypothetical protein
MSASKLRAHMRTVLLFIGTTNLLGSSLVAVPPTASATAGIVCAPEQSVFAVHTNGTLYRYPFDDLSSTVTPAVGPRTAVGSGWQMFGRVLGGPNGLVYGLKASGLYEYQWAGTGFAGPPRNITTTFSGFVSGTNRPRLTVDGSGAFYAVTGPNLDGLYRYIIDPAQGKIVNVQLMATGWSKYNMIIGAGDGVIYSRDADGILYRTSFDPGSHRLIEATKQVGSGWNQFSMIVSVGADILLAAQPGGTMFHYRYDETTSQWPITGRQIGTGWNQFYDLPAIVDECKLTATHTPPPVSIPAQPGAPVAVLPSADGKRIDYSYVDSSTGEIEWGHQRDVNNFGSTVWPALQLTSDRFVGTPAVIPFGTNQAAIIAQRNDGHFMSAYQSTPEAEVLSALRPEGGVMTGDATAVMRPYPWIVQPDSPIPAVLVVDSDGSLWRSSRSAKEFLDPWERVTSQGMTGTPAISEWVPTTTLTVARTASGGVVGWTEGVSDFPAPPKVIDIGGTGLTGRITNLGGQIFARNSSGEIQTTNINWDRRQGKLVIDPWSKVGGDEVSFAGSPSALTLDSGETVVAARATDGYLYTSSQATFQDPFTPWKKRSAFQVAADPTAFKYTNAAGATWAFVSYTQDYQLYTFTPPAGSGSGTAKAIAADDLFEAHLIKE